MNLHKGRHLGKLCRLGHESDVGSGQSWRYDKSGRCPLCVRAATNGWATRNPTKASAAVKNASANYRVSEKGRARQARENAKRATPEGKAKQQEYNRQYIKTPSGAAARASGTRRYRISSKCKETAKLYMAAHREEYREHNRRYFKRVRAEGGEAHVRILLRQQFHNRMRALSTNGKCKPSAEYGIDYEVIAAHLGPRPSRNHWVDHIIPVTYFDHDDPAQIQVCWHPANLRWIPKGVNIGKGNKLPDEWPTGLPFIRGTGTAANQELPAWPCLD